MKTRKKKVILSTNPTVELAKTVRKTWAINPNTRFHSSPRGKKVYDRKETRKAERDY